MAEIVLSCGRLTSMVNSSRGRPRGAPVARQLLLEAAQLHFLAGDLAETSHRALAAEVGVSHTLVNYHFGSRDGLFAAAAALTISPGEVIAVARRADGSLDLHRLAHALVAVWEHPEHGARLASIARSFARGDATAEAISHYLQRTVIDALIASYGRHKGAQLITAVVGFIFARYILGVDAIARLTQTEAVRLLYSSLR